MVDKFEVRLFGTISFLLNNQPLKSTSTRASQALLIYLLHQKSPVEREQLIDMFFQTSTPKQASANFRSILSRLRKELALFLAISNRTVAIAPGTDIWIDSAEFEKQMAIKDVESALPLYQGDFLAGFFLRDAPEFENWALVERERLRLLAIEGLQTKVATHQQQGDYWAGLKAVNRLLAVEPLLEEMHRVKMMLLARTGQRALALQHYEKTAVFFETELGVALSPETTRLYERIGTLTTPPPLKLSVPTDQFVGRENEIGTLTQLLREPSRRLITLFGIGGIGKTRLALETARYIAANHAGSFLNGIYFISMLTVEPSETHNAIAFHLMQTMGIALGGPQSPAEQAIAALKEQEMLLIVDNFEHLIDHNSSFLSQLISEAPGIKLIVTSRERLSLVEETVFDLTGLPYDAHNSLESDAAQLFVTHAQRHQFTFSPTVNDVLAITRMCQLLEGIPLGIELAAGSVRYSNCGEIAQQIEDNLGDLSSPLRNVPERHRSLRAMFLYSWHLLAPELRPVFANLAVFPASFDAAAAKAIAGATRTQLNTLLDKALLKVENGRFTIHPLLQTFAAEQIDAEQHNALHNTHCGYFAQFIAERSQSYHRPTYLKGLPDLVTAYDDLVLAWRWGIKQLIANESERVWEWAEKMRRPLTRLHFQKNWFHAARTLYGEARQRLEEAGWHDSAAAMRHRLLHAQITVAECNSARILGDVASTIAPVEAAIPLLRQNVTLDDLFDAYNILVGINMQKGNSDVVPEYLDELEAIATESQKPILFGVLYVSRSYFKNFMGDTGGALSFARQALAVFQSMEDTYYEAIVLDGIARRLFTLNRPDEAADNLRRAYVLAEENGQALTKAFIQKGLAVYYKDKGELEEAEQALAESRHLFVEVNDQRNLVEIDHSQAVVDYKRRNWASMTRHLIASLQRAQSQRMKTHVLNVIVHLPILQWQRGAQVAAYTLALALQAQETLSDKQQKVVDEALDMMGEELSDRVKREAIATAHEIHLDDVANTFLREGLSWFLPQVAEKQSVESIL